MLSSDGGGTGNAGREDGGSFSTIVHWGVAKRWLILAEAKWVLEGTSP